MTGEVLPFKASLSSCNEKLALGSKTNCAKEIPLWLAPIIASLCPNMSSYFQLWRNAINLSPRFALVGGLGAFSVALSADGRRLDITPVSVGETALLS